ncbi:MAG: lasso peptide biosynthesis B2 protein, partial [Acidobacteriota bacterium]
MNRLKQFTGLPQADRRLLLRGFRVVVGVRLALWLVPFRVVRRWAAGRQVSKRPEKARVRSLSWAVQAAARRIPGASCLTQALALQYLLARAGENARVRIGVSIGEAGGF